MAVRPTTLALENLESRLNLSSLLGGTFAVIPSRQSFVQERATLKGANRLISLQTGSAVKTKALVAQSLIATASAESPAPDINVTATQKAITISWQNNSINETGFHIERSTNGATFTLIANVDAGKTSYTDTKTVLGTSYTYRVTAFNKSQDTAASHLVTASLQLPPAPATPNQLSASKITTSSVTLSWKDNANNETGYRVYRSTDGVHYTLLAALKAGAQTYTDAALSAGKTYFYKVSAWNAGGETYTAEPLQTATLLAPPAAPTTVALSNITSNSINVSWSETSQNVEGFRIYRSTNGGAYTLIGNAPVGTNTFTNSGLLASTRYSYEVSAWNASVDMKSKSTTGITLVAPAAAPTNLAFNDVTTSGVTLSWTDNSKNETGFHIYRSTNGSTYTLAATVAANTTQYSDTNLSAGTTYWYKVTSFSTAGEANTEGKSVTTLTPTTHVAEAVAPAAPTNLTLSNTTTTSITVNWTENTDNVSGIHVYRTTDGINYTLIGSLSATATTWTDSGLQANTSYGYKIGAWNSTSETTSSVVGTSTLAEVPNAPSGVSFLNVTASALTLNWNAPGNQTGYHVFRSTDGVNYTLVGTLAADAVSWNDSGLAANSTYFYSVSAYDNAGETRSTGISVTTLATAPTAPTGINITNVTASGSTVNWTAPGNQTGYHIYRSTDGTHFTLVGSTGPGDTSWTDSGLSPSTSYFYSVGAFNSGGETRSANVYASTSTAISSNPITISSQNMTSFNELVIVGTSSADSIVVSQSGSTLNIVANGQTYTESGSYGDIKIYGVSGNDTITVNSSVNIAALIYGGTGSDIIKNLTTGKATIVTIGGGTNTVTGNGVNTSYWVNTGDIVNASAAEIALGGVNRVTNFYQPFSTDSTNANYVPRTLLGQNLTDPTDSGTETRLMASSFWGTGPSMNDINQTGLADCYYLAPLASLAYSEPQKLMNMGVDLGDGTYAVRFVRNGVTSYVRVDGDLSTGYWNDGLANQTPGADGNEWGSIFEKAYAFYRSASNTYASLNWGSQFQTYYDLGLTSTAMSPSFSTASVVMSTINTQLSAGHGVVASTNGTITAGSPLIESHVYTIIGAYTDSTGTVMIQLRNPWGVDGAGNDGNPNDGLVTISFATLAANFNSLNYTLA